MKTNENITFNKEAKKFILSLIKQRQHILNAGKSKKNPARCATVITYLRTYITNLTYTDYQMAGFLLRNKEKLYFLLPGNQLKRREELNSLMHRAHQLHYSKHLIKTY